MKLFAAVVLFAFVLPAFGSEFGDGHPSGAIKDRAQAEQALREADAEAARIDREAAAREAECHKGFLVNKCRDEVRRDKLIAERELRRVRVEAHDLQRKLDAEDAARKRAESPAPAAKPAPTKREPPTSRAIPPDEAARNRAAYDKRVEEKRKSAAEEQARAPERAANAREFEAKQAEAERRAKEKEAERKKNEERRAERRKQSEVKEAQREELRRKAEEAAKAIPKP
jgi:colicin import membrane protein